MPSSDSVWRKGSAPIKEPLKTPSSPPWRRNTPPAAPRGLNPTATEFAWDRQVVASSGASPDASPKASIFTITPEVSFAALPLSPSPSPERKVTPQPAFVRPGFIYRAQIRRARASGSLVNQQPHVNDQVESHPAMVWDVYQQQGVAVARCLQMTSFGGKGVEAKFYPHAWRMDCGYLPVQQGGTTSRTNQPILALQDGDKMKSQTFVNLDHFFEIEARFLVSWGANCPSPIGLAADSLDVLRAKLFQFARGGTFRHRNERLGMPVSPLDSMGPPQFSDEVQQAAAHGRALEDARRKSMAKGEHIYTGLEARNEWPTWSKFR